MEYESLIVEFEPVGPFAMNSYLIGCAKTREAAIIDSGGASERMLRLAEEHELKVTKLLQTHAHIDHIAGLGEMKRLTGAPIFLHPADQPVYASATTQGRFFGFQIEQPPPVDEDLADSDVIRVGELALSVLHTPGHCPGHVCFFARDQNVMFAGDLLFRGSIGRTDLPGGDPGQMKASLERIKRELADETVVCPGHMGPTTMGRERLTNPFLSGMW